MLRDILKKKKPTVTETKNSINRLTSRPDKTE